mmetsp:Transcript_59048/g.156745  ORF Transcript_59048/g.156745 Transcript_59048/m.156745 type:complete len:81 (-) Transcript_59048:222-464(-)
MLLSSVGSVPEGLDSLCSVQCVSLFIWCPNSRLHHHILLQLGDIFGVLLLAFVARAILSVLDANVAIPVQSSSATVGGAC